jgi:hypothetical protein
MSRHVSYRGTTIDMDSMRRENEKVTAVGNMGANAKGDRIKGTKVTKTADEMARERGRVQSVVVNTGLKGPMPKVDTPVLESPKPTSKPVQATTTKKVKEVELPSGDIVIEDDSNDK